MIPSDVRAWAEIDLNAVRSNVVAIRRAVGPQTETLAVVKADAYGHGLIEVSRAALEAGVSWLGVATVGEGVALREAGICSPIVLLCVPLPGQAHAIAINHIVPAVGDEGLLIELAHEAAAGSWGAFPPIIHLDVDTGMGRSGVQPDAALAFWRLAQKSGLHVTGITTHFADADGETSAFSDEQAQKFERARRELACAGANLEVVHRSNSAATLRLGAGGNLVRPGLLLYGILPPIPGLTETDRKGPVPIPQVQPALTLKARVATVRDLPSGHAVSYGATCRLTRASRVATVLIGYGDGYPRRLSNMGVMLLNGRRAPILGRVCMDQTVLDVTDIPGVHAGDEAVCIGSQGGERISIEKMAALIGATEHEIPTGLTGRIPRFYIGG